MSPKRCSFLSIIFTFLCVPQLVPKIDRTRAKEYSKLCSLSSILLSPPEHTANENQGDERTKSMKGIRYASELWELSGKPYRRTSSRFGLDPVATGTSAWYHRGNWLYKSRKY